VVAWLLSKPNAVVGENGVDLIGHRLEHVLQELPGGLPVSPRDESGNGKLAYTVNTHEEVESAFSDPDLGNVHMKEADGVKLELLTLLFVTLHIRQSRDGMTLKALM
jgi:hypothetical protein